jgi:hypothetical protein
VVTRKPNRAGEMLGNETDQQQSIAKSNLDAFLAAADPWGSRMYMLLIMIRAPLGSIKFASANEAMVGWLDVAREMNRICYCW